MNACCGEQRRNERLKLALHWTVSQRVSVVQRCARAGDDATPRTVRSRLSRQTSTLTCCNCMQFHNFQKVSSFKRTALLHTTATLFVNFWIQHSPAVDRQGCCHGMATTIPGHNAIRLLLVGYVKQHVFSERINDINHLKQRITDVIHSVTPHVLTRVWEELEYRLDVCKATYGTHIELR
ncbi:hypothetical protein AVEN_209758-1 [Araneus ventricosus]|uniref:DUF4817 domain-containing protein n=1 Tax=Araneus ventricosus TaxID=182803 RepID=A0A4Y2CCB0_ARAVE|nr:hypothetical protein AVEN_209758-1 [Araneus ventricosus]